MCWEGGGAGGHGYSALAAPPNPSVRCTCFAIAACCRPLISTWAPRAASRPRLLAPVAAGARRRAAGADAVDPASLRRSGSTIPSRYRRPVRSMAYRRRPCEAVDPATLEGEAARSCPALPTLHRASHRRIEKRTQTSAWAKRGEWRHCTQQQRTHPSHHHHHRHHEAPPHLEDTLPSRNVQWKAHHSTQIQGTWCKGPHVCLHIHTESERQHALHGRPPAATRPRAAPARSRISHWQACH
jgi:hypothetical protein